jgi:hypothetical protein
MQTLSGFPFIDMHFDKDGVLQGTNHAKEVIALLDQSKITDLIVMSHGWNNDEVEAKDLYERFFKDVRPVADSLGEGRSWGVVGVFWPSKKFGDKALPASPAAGLATEHLQRALVEQLDTLSDLFPGRKEIDEARSLVPTLEDSEQARVNFVKSIRGLLRQSNGDREDSPPQFFLTSGDKLIDRLGKPLPASIPKTVRDGGAARFAQSSGHATAILPSLTGVLGGALNFLNYATYYEMKERAATVGVRGLAPQMRGVRNARPAVGLHLVGHSFGARLVTATVAGAVGGESLPVDTLVLLQGAFSHYGFSDDYDDKGSAGYFRRVVSDHLVRGPLVVSCTQNDQAVGRLYPLASLVAGQVASGLGDPNSPYGGLGANGAQKSDARSESIHEQGTPYEWKAGAIHNLNADACIMNHSDICKPQVAFALISGACHRPLS